MLCSYKTYFLLMLIHILVARTKYFAYSTDLRDILIQKPYEEICDEPTSTPIPEISDQLSDECPLAYKSSSKTTGCSCDLKSQAVNCIYMDRLNRLPAFFPISTDSKIKEWNLDLRCKNFTQLLTFKPFLNLKNLNLLDLSGGSNSNCKRTNGLNISTSERSYLTKIGVESSVRIQKYNRSEILRINELNLDSNRIKAFDLSDQMDNSEFHLKIKNLRLSNNLIEKIYLRSQLDVCDLELESLDLSKNRLPKIEIGYLIFLSRLNLSSNLLTSFLIDFYDNKDFQNYYSEWCNLEANFKSNILYSNLINLDFSYNFLTSLPFNYLNINYSNLTSLNLSSNRLRTLNNLEFASMKNLKYLSLKSNLIDKLSDKTLSGLGYLIEFDLSNNYVSEIPKHFFNEQDKSLEILNLNQNQLSHIPKEVFKHLASVKYLYLNRNKIQILRNYSFGFMANLLEVYLAENQIDTIELYSFFIDHRSVVGPGLIEKIDLSYNRLYNLTSPIFSYLTNLRYLILNNNHLKVIDQTAFTGVNYLISLDISLNRIEDLNFLFTKNFSHLRYLKLSNNQISSIRPGQFSFLKSLNNLDLSANRIKFINSCAFQGLQNSIKKLLLNFNQISRLNSCAFTLGFRNLRFVQILNNPLNCTNNCEFFFTIYNPPYSINYEGVECVNTTQTSMEHCSIRQYEKIHLKCKNLAKTKDCNIYNDLEPASFLNLNEQPVDYAEIYGFGDDGLAYLSQSDTNSCRKNFVKYVFQMKFLFFQFLFFSILF